MASRSTSGMQRSTRTRKAVKKTPSSRESMTTRNDANSTVRGDDVRPASGGAVMDSPSLRQQIAQTAYFIAERRGFAPGHEFEDWVQAEAEVQGWLKVSE